MAISDLAGNSQALFINGGAPPTDASVVTSPVARNKRTPEEQARHAALVRRSSGRRRFVDPTTCDRDYSEAEMEFMQAMQDYKEKSARMFPTWSEVLEVFQGSGYEKVHPNLG